VTVFDSWDELMTQLTRADSQQLFAISQRMHQYNTELRALLTRHWKLVLGTESRTAFAPVSASHSECMCVSARTLTRRPWHAPNPFPFVL
jgi:hypothetical protein